MVHNGIEYGDMQLICEAYWILKHALGLTNDELYEVFAEWNHGELDSYLIEITRDIFSVRDPETGGYLVDCIMDAAGAKGTGKWMSQLALDLGSAQHAGDRGRLRPLPLGLARRPAPCLSQLSGPTGKYEGDRRQFIEQVRQALYASKIVSYAQGYVQMQAAAVEYKWPLDLGPIALLWRGGCIIRAVFLQRIKDAFDADPEAGEPALGAVLQRRRSARPRTAWRNVVATAVRLGIPTPAFSSALAYYDGYRSPRLPANLLQAQRDYFGATPTTAIDRPGVFHSDWLRLRKQPK